MLDLTKNVEKVTVEKGVSKKGTNYVLLHVVFKQGYDYQAFANKEQQFILTNLPHEEIEKN